MAALLERTATKFTKVRISPKGDRSAAVVSRIDKGTVTLPGASNCAANTTTEISIALPASFSTPAATAGTFDMVKVNPTAAITAGIGIVGAYISAAGTPYLGNPLNPAVAATAATLKIRFMNATAGIIDAAGVYNVVLFRN